MEKRLLYAVLLSIAFLIAWGALVPRFFPEMARPQPPAVTETIPPDVRPDDPAFVPPPAVDPTAEPPVEAVAPPPVTAPSIPAAAEVIETVVELPEYVARFTNRGGQLVSFQLRNHFEADGSRVELVRHRSPDRTDFPFMLISSDAAWNSDINAKLFQFHDEIGDRGERVLRYEVSDITGATVRKTFSFPRGEVAFQFDIEVGRSGFPYRTMVGPGIRNPDLHEEDTQFRPSGNLLVQRDGSLDTIQRDKAASFQTYSQPQFVGVADNYFVKVLIPRISSEAVASSQLLALDPEREPRRELYAGLNAAPGGRINGLAYFGAKEAELLDRYGLENILRFGIFGFISRLLLAGLQFIYSYTGNWGWAIVLLTVVIKLLLYPLQHKAIVSMKRMQVLQPKVAALKEKYKKAKTDPEQRQKMNMEMMALYKQEGINPLGGCLPILLQLPILWAFYTLLSNAIELRGAEWILWINDLSLKDPYYITPILMTATMFIQQWITPTTVDPLQRKIFLAMPIIFGWIFKEFPSGLVLYWLVQNVLTIVQQLIMNKYWKDHPESLKKA